MLMTKFFEDRPKIMGEDYDRLVDGAEFKVFLELAVREIMKADPQLDEEKARKHSLQRYRQNYAAVVERQYPYCYSTHERRAFREQVRFLYREYGMSLEQIGDQFHHRIPLLSGQVPFVALADGSEAPILPPPPPFHNRFLKELYDEVVVEAVFESPFQRL